jgi:hypothetical protein
MASTKIVTRVLGLQAASSTLTFDICFASKTHIYAA